MTGQRKHLIIGSGAAGLAAARTIRSLSKDDKIKMVTRENMLPYSLAALPYLISGKVAESDLWLIGDPALEELNITLTRGKEVTTVASQEKKLIYDDGEHENYDTLLVASGSYPVPPPIKGLDEVEFSPFHTLDDFRVLRERLKGKNKVLVYGGGLVAVEMAIALVEAGYEVTLTVRSRILRRYFDPEVVDMIKPLLVEKGVHIREGGTIEEARREDGHVRLEFSDGSSLTTEALATGTGVKPSISFLADSGLDINEGVLVDRHLQTNVADVYAAGDVAEAPGFFTGERGLSPIWPSAVRQGKVAGRNMAGEETEYKGWIPMNILHFFGHRAFSVGITDGPGTEVLHDIDDEHNAYKKLCFDGEHLIGASFLDVDVFPGLFGYLIEHRVTISADERELLLSKPRETSSWLMLRTEKEQSMSLEE
jgi:NAD(P)H-nitrite reductase large subunit